jgi:hypothetical protein
VSTLELVAVHFSYRTEPDSRSADYVPAVRLVCPKACHPASRHVVEWERRGVVVSRGSLLKRQTCKTCTQNIHPLIPSIPRVLECLHRAGWINSAGTHGGVDVTVQRVGARGFNSEILFRPSSIIPLSCLPLAFFFVELLTRVKCEVV